MSAICTGDQFVHDAQASGVRDDLIASAMHETLEKLTPSNFFTDDAQKVIEEVERKEVARLDKAEWYRRFAYVVADDSYYDLEDRKEYFRGSFNAIYRHVSCRSIHNNAKIEAATCFDENRQAMGARVLLGITYAAGETELVARDGDVYGNRWRNARPVPVPGDVTPWLAHCEAIVPDKDEREHIFDVMAYKVQHPNVKINHAVLHGGTQGCGKDTMWAPFIHAVCGPGRKNLGLLDNDTLNSTWGYALESEILILNELKEPEARERRALANRLKPIIAAPPEMLTINRKGLHPYMALNRLFVLAYSNERAAISLPSDDRRWFVVWSEAERMNDADSIKLWNWYRSGGLSAVCAYLYARDVSHFNAGGVPPMTEAKQVLIGLGLSTAESYLVDMMNNRVGVFQRGVIGSPFHATCEALQGYVPAGVKVPQAALLHALREAGWIDKGRLASADYMGKKHIFCAPDMANHSKYPAAEVDLPVCLGIKLMLYLYL
mgnify:CR=1 FL=1